MGTTAQTRFMFTVVRKTDMVADTIDELMRMFSWSMNILLSGETPLTDYHNRPLSDRSVPLDPVDKMRGVLCQCRGDWEFYRTLFYFGAWNQDHMCYLCQASATDRARSWTDFGLDAAWRALRYTHESYIAMLLAGGFAVPVLFALCIGFRLECVMVDPLHCVDQGVALNITANIIWIIAVLRNSFGGSTYASRIKNCAADLKRWYKENPGYRLQGDLTQERVRPSGDWPKLRAKAAQTRHLARYALYLMQTYAQLESVDDFVRVHDQLALGCAQLLVQYYDLMNANSVHLSVATQIQFAQIGNQMGILYSRLASLCFDRGQRLWKLSPKCHMFVHMLVDQISFGNPRFWWTYGDEDLVRILIGVADSVHPKTLAISVLCKWLWCVFDQLVIDPDVDLDA